MHFLETTGNISPAALNYYLTGRLASIYCQKYLLLPVYSE